MTEKSLMRSNLGGAQNRKGCGQEWLSSASQGLSLRFVSPLRGDGKVVVGNNGQGWKLTAYLHVGN